ncbi:unnamed protein product [Ixodes pacificus]
MFNGAFDASEQRRSPASHECMQHRDRPRHYQDQPYFRRVPRPARLFIIHVSGRIWLEWPERLNEAIKETFARMPFCGHWLAGSGCPGKAAIHFQKVVPVGHEKPATLVMRVQSAVGRICREGGLICRPLTDR